MKETSQQFDNITYPYSQLPSRGDGISALGQEEDETEDNRGDEIEAVQEEDDEGSLIKQTNTQPNEGEMEGEFEDDEQSEDEQIPLLFVDVNLGSTMERIVLYEGDDPEDVAAEFAKKNQLDSVMEVKLKDLLKKQIANVLVKIDEDEEMDD